MSSLVQFQPNVSENILRGINKLSDAIRPTLGPLPRRVAISRLNNDQSQAPELLDCGGVIAQRIYQLPGYENTGAMMMRQTLYALLERVGDGTATAALLYQQIFSEGLKYILSGGNAVHLRHYLEQGLNYLLQELDKLSVPFEKNQLNIQKFVESHCHDRELAILFSDILDTMGEDAYIQVQPDEQSITRRLYVRGCYWKGGLNYIPAEQLHSNIELYNPFILISDLNINDPSELVPFLDLVLSKGINSIVLIANSISEKAISLLLANQNAGKFRFMAVKPPYYKIGQYFEGIEDLSILTGGKPFLQACGDLLSRICIDDLGSARKAWANKDSFGIVGGNGTTQERKQHYYNLKKTRYNTDSAIDVETLLHRLSNIWGGSVVLYVGGRAEEEIRDRLDMAKRCVKIFRSVSSYGLLPGAGSAYLACRIKLKNLFEPTNEDKNAAFHILYNALEQPARVIAQNSGYDSYRIVREFEEHFSDKMKPVDYKGFDVLSGKVVNLYSAGILDLSQAQKEALRYAVLGASQALSVNVIVHPRKPDMSLSP